MAGGHLGKNCLKKSPFVKKQFVPMAAFGYIYIYVFNPFYQEDERRMLMDRLMQEKEEHSERQQECSIVEYTAQYSEPCSCN